MCVAENVRQCREQIAMLETKSQELEAKPPRMSIERIADDPKKMLLYTSFTYDVFKFLCNTVDRFQPLTYYCGWRVTSVSSEDQLLLTLMKLTMNCKDLDLAERFCISKTSVSNIFHTYVCALHEILFDGILQSIGIPSQCKCTLQNALWTEQSTYPCGLSTVCLCPLSMSAMCHRLQSRDNARRMMGSDVVFVLGGGLLRVLHSMEFGAL